MNNLIKCDSCNKLIASSQINIQDKTIKPGIHKRSWYCVHCNHEYLIIITNKQTRRMMEENKKDRVRIGNMNKRSDILDSKGKLVQSKLDKHMDKINVIEERINERTKRIDDVSGKMIDEYKEAL